MALIPNAVKTLKGKQFWGGGGVKETWGKARQTSLLSWIFFFFICRNLISLLVCPFTIRDKWVRRISPYLLVNCKYMWKRRRRGFMCRHLHSLQECVWSIQRCVKHTLWEPIYCQQQRLNPYLQAIITQHCHVNVLLCVLQRSVQGLFLIKRNVMYTVRQGNQVKKFGDKCPIHVILRGLTKQFFCICSIHTFTDRRMCVMLLAPYWMIAGKHCHSKETRD